MKSRRYSSLTLLAALSALIIFAAGCCEKRATQTTQTESPAKPVEPAAVATEAAGVATEPAPATAPSDATAQPAAAAAPVSAAPSAPRSPSTVLVKVDDTAITQGHVDKEIAKMEVMMKNTGLSPDKLAALMPNLEPQVIEGLVTRALLDNECQKNKITVTDDEVKAEIENIKADLPEDVTLDAMLKQSGLTQAMFESDLKEHLKIKKLLNIAEPTPDQIKAYYEENKQFFEIPEMARARHILIKTDEKDAAEAKAAKKEKAEKLRKQLVEGADFEKLAAENSDCPSKSQGGSLGKVRRGQMVLPFEEATFSLKTNEISSVVETQFGYHIIQVSEHSEPKSMTFDEVKGRIATVIKAKEFQEKAGSLIDGLKEKATITYTNGVTPPSVFDDM